jgi:hypothetical protein
MIRRQATPPELVGVDPIGGGNFRRIIRNFRLPSGLHPDGSAELPMAKFWLEVIAPDKPSRSPDVVLDVSRVPCVGEDLEAPVRGRYRYFKVVEVTLICNPHPEVYDASVRVTQIPLSRKTLRLLD